MISGHAIIGANFGDEGKGLMTDYFASRNPENSIVVRFNGGAQAGHTVVCPDGRRHVFSHFGSGTFVDCPTYLSQFFIVNPIMFVRELSALSAMAKRPTVFLDERACVTTPFDMFINQLVETKRGTTRHGSCGLGVNEAVNRSLRSPALRITVRDLHNRQDILHRLCHLSRIWLPARLTEYQIDPNCTDVVAFKEKEQAIFQQFINDAQTMLENSVVCSQCPLRRMVIFEGAQGLMLDEDRIDQWPHVTRSKTGLTNVVYLARKIGIEDLQVTYVTRTYLTRHGAGPLPGERDWSFDDPTNIPNAFQGRLRYAPLDQGQLCESIRMDFQYARLSLPNLRGDLAVTCADQLALAALGNTLSVAYVSYGPTRLDVHALPASQCQQRLSCV